jgi:hypothetical protein
MAFTFPKSKAGKNAYNFRCETLERPVNYAICQFVIEAFMQKRLNGTFTECAKCIGAKTCPAIKMIAEEKKAGKVLYWEDYHRERVPAMTKRLPPQETYPHEEKFAPKTEGDTLTNRAKFLAERDLPANGVKPEKTAGKIGREKRWGGLPDKISTDSLTRPSEKELRQEAKTKPVPKKAETDFGGSDYADVVNKMMDKEKRA